MATTPKDIRHERLEAMMEENVNDSFMLGKINTILVEYIPDIAINVKVKVNEGVVTLEGIAKDYVGKDAITEHIGNLTGVKSVINHMKVENSLSHENSFNRNRRDLND